MAEVPMPTPPTFTRSFLYVDATESLIWADITFTLTFALSLVTR